MAGRRIHEEDIRLDIIINNSQAQRDLFELEKKTKDLVSANKDLKKEQRLLEAQGKKNTQEYRNLTNQINQNTAQIRTNRAEMDRLQNEIGLTGLTMNQLTRRANQLRNSLRDMVPGSRQWQNLNAELTETTNRINQLRAAGDTQRLTFGQAADWLNRYQTMILSVTATITGLTYSIQQWLDYSGKLADANSNVMKVTGFTQKQIDELNKSLGNISTRTSRMELLGLAEQAGRLGKTSLKEVEGFVEVANRLKVALGDDLGESQILDVGKLVTTYQVGTETGKEFEGAMEALGSSINEVSASGSNQASFLVDYMNRMAGVAPQAKLSAADNLGYAATFDELGQSVEVTSTAMNKVLLDMFKNPGEYAKIAGISIKDFNKLLNEDSNAAMIKFLEGLNGNSAGLQTMVQKMEDLDAGGTRGVASLSALANNLDILKQRQATANLSMQEATSLTNEYNIKNNNLAATLDKIKKTTAGWFSSDTLVSWLTTCVNWFAKLIGATEDADKSGARWRNNLLVIAKVVATLVAGLISYKAALQLTALWTNRNTAGSILYNAQLKLQNILAAIAIVRTELYAAAQLLLAGNIRGAIAQVRALNTVLFASPWGVVIGLVTAATTAFFLFSDSANEANDIMSATTRIANDVADATTNQKSKIETLIATINDENSTLEQKQKALEILKTITNGYLDTLTLENMKTGQSIQLIKDYIKHIDDLAKAKAIVALKTELYSQQLKNSTKITALETEKKNTKATGKGYGDDGKFFGFDIGRNQKSIQYEIDQAKSENIQIENQLAVANTLQGKQSEAIRNRIAKNTATLKTLKANSAEAKQLTAKIKADNEELNALIGLSDTTSTTANNSSSEFTTPSDKESEKARKKAEKDAENARKKAEREADNARKKAKAERDKYYEDLKKETEKNEEEILKIQRDYEDLGLESIEDSFAKERATMSVEHQRKMDDLRAQLIDEKTLKILNEQKATATKNGDTALVARIDQMKATYLSKNAEINDLLTAQQNKYSNDLLQLSRKFQLSEIDKLVESGNKKIEEQKRLQRSELATISSVDDAKEILKRSLNDKELKEIKTWQDAKTALEKQYEQETLALQEEFLREQLSQLQAISQGSTEKGIDFNLLTPEQQENFKSQIEELKSQIDELIIKKNELKGQGEDDKSGNKKKKSDDGNSKGSLNKYSADIFGMSTDDWQMLFNHLEQGKIGFEEIAAVIGVMQQMYAQYAQMVAANENRELQKFEDRTNRKKDALSRQLDQGYINQATYNAEVQKLEDAYNKKKAETEYKQAKREKQMALVSALMGTATAVVGALGMKPWTPANYALAAIVGAFGAIQTGMIAAQPLPSKGFEDGYINIQREQDGKRFRAKRAGIAKTGLVSQPTHFLAGEQGQHFPEMIIDGPTWKGLSPDIKNALQNDIMRVKGFENGSYGNIASTDNTEFIAFLKLNYELLSDLKTNGIDARVLADYRNSAAIEKGIERVRKFKNKTIK
ncbi:phage tail tape measure protein [Empedobacter falsenii]|uniref:Phage tail tape measure protein, TP901 family, core region n=1 Tax=Empedobacter falsenii TaxID=343874 RepID=A0A376FZJ5_9FLAO|nr:phage tail tape measure protein [Empedobacter falsenii]STD53111.1 phage tail tape measure protein, TP901 family, core region [Empedobacter falsenii]